jgi:hypothetical protein
MSKQKFSQKVEENVLARWRMYKQALLGVDWVVLMQKVR